MSIQFSLDFKPRRLDQEFGGGIDASYVLGGVRSVQYTGYEGEVVNVGVIRLEWVAHCVAIARS